MWKGKKIMSFKKCLFVGTMVAIMGHICGCSNSEINNNGLSVGFKPTPTIKMENNVEISPTVTNTPIPTPTPTPEPLRKVLDVKYMSQLPDYPTGCESVSTIMILNYLGYNIDIDTFIDRYLPIVSEPKIIEGENLFNHYFVGNPRSTYGWLCFVPPIKHAIESYFIDIGEFNKIPFDLTGTEFEDIIKEIENGNPVVIWATIGYKEPSLKERDFGYYYTPSHTVALVGYDKEKGTVIINDPLETQLELEYDKVKSLYDAVGKRALVIKDKEFKSVE